MKPIIPWTCGAILPLLAGPVGCAGSETGNGEAEHREVAVVMMLGGGASLVAPDDAGVAFTIDAAQVLVEELDLWLPDGEPCSGLAGVATVVGHAAPYVPACTEDDTKLRVLGPWAVDLVTGELEPPLDALDLPDGTYARLAARLRPARAGEGGVGHDDVLDGATIDVAGHVVLGGTTRQWDLRLDFTDEARFVPTTPIEVGPGVTSLLLTLEVESWFATLDLAACMTAGEVPTSADGTFRLAELAPRCGNIDHAIRTALKQHGRLATR